MILSIETSIHICSVALHDLEGNLLALHELHEQRKHAERLTLLVEAVLKTTQTKFSDLKAIAVGSGGRFLYRSSHWRFDGKRTLYRFGYSSYWNSVFAGVGFVYGGFS